MARVTLVALAIVAALCIQHSWAVQHNVGGSQGWEATTNLQEWVSTQQFNVGDTLVFKYSNIHTVDEVDKAGYDACSITNAISSASDGNTVVKLSAPGKRYFICGSVGHCPGGMKIEVDTLAGLATTPAKAPLTSSPPAQAVASPAPAVASPAPSDGAPTMATIPSSPTPSDGAPTAATIPSDGAPVASTRRTSSPAPSPSSQNGATVKGISSVVVAGAAIVAFFML